MDGPQQRLEQGLDALRQASDPLSRLDAGRAVREAAAQLEADLVDEARAASVSWKRIGAVYGTTKQGAQQRFRPAKHAPSPADHADQ